MIDNFEFKEKYDINDLLDIMKILRAPGGCPWDAEQDHMSIKKNFIEETYEVVEAINKNDSELLKEELGDVMLQVVFHAKMEEEKGVFDFSDVADGICKKLIIRHPHVFGDVKVGGTDDVLTNWDAIKRQTKHQKSTTEAMESVPRELPALMRCEKIQHKAAKNGVEAKDALSYLTTVTDGICADGKVTKDKLGELLFAATAVARAEGIDPEDALSGETDKFLKQYSEFEKGNVSSEDFYKEKY